MNEPPGLPSALGIEAVEWLGQGTESLTVRVRGRWRRRRPTWSGQPLLVIETEGTRHRFPAMPEPPSLTGAAPGTWQMSFTVPASVAGGSGMRAWLQLGSVAVPLPVPVRSESPPPAADEETLGLRRARAAELAAEAAARRLVEAEAIGRALEQRLEELEAELERLNAALAERDQAVRRAEQRAHAERALREELEERFATTEDAETDLSEDPRALRIDELERELEQLRRALDEAEHVARAAASARRRAEARLEELVRLEPAGRDLRDELALAERAAPVPQIEPRATPHRPADAERLGRERQMLDARTRSGSDAETIEALQRELAARAQSEASLRAALVQRERAPVPAGDETLRAALSELRAELGHLRDALERETLGRERAERRVREAYDAIQEVRDELAWLRGGPAPRGRPASGPPTSDTEPVEAERLTAALSRLRESTPPREEDRITPRAGWLERALRALARQDRAAAAMLLEELLPAPASDARRVAGLLAAGPLGRRLRRGSARVRGRGELLELVEQVTRAAIGLERIRVEPRAALALVAAMVEPEWTIGQRFTIAYDSGPFLTVRDGERLLVTATPLGEVSSTVICEPALLAGVLAGARPPGVVVHGQHHPLELLREWVERAQSA